METAILNSAVYFAGFALMVNVLCPRWVRPADWLAPLLSAKGIVLAVAVVLFASVAPLRLLVQEVPALASLPAFFLGGLSGLMWRSFRCLRHSPRRWAVQLLIHIAVLQPYWTPVLLETKG